MKKFILITSISFICGLAQASDAGLFNVDEEKIKNELRELNELEDFVSQHEGVTLSELNINAELRSSLNDGMLKTLAALNNYEPPLGIPSFCWGCALSWVGVLITYLITEDKEETTKALYGCLAQGAAYLIFYVVYIVWIVSWTGYY